MVTYEDVNKGIEKVLEYLYTEDIKKVWDSFRDLKLHEVFFHNEEYIDKYPFVKEKYSREQIFSDFCDASYEDFIEWMEQEEIEDCRKYIGRTSSFYLTDLHDRKKEHVLDNAIGATLHYTDYCTFDSCCHLKKFSDDPEEEKRILEKAQDEMKYFAEGEFLSDIKKYMEDPIKEAEYIDSFKKNQLETFDDFLSSLNSFLEYEAEEERKRDEEIQTATMACYI